MKQISLLTGSVLLFACTTVFAGPPKLGDKKLSEIPKMCVEYATKETEKIKNPDEAKKMLYKHAKECIMSNGLVYDVDLTEPHIKAEIKKRWG